MVPLFVAASFLSASLLFLVQPMAARVVLPTYGGSPAVWATSVLFFQTALLLGYLYAHFGMTRLRPRLQVLLHVIVLLLPLIVLPIALPNWAEPDSAVNPALRLLV